ncbi:MAG TPA: histidine triad nucleotide-binding protein [Anaerolineales bacterium]
MVCIFCKIISGESPAKILHRDDLVTAFRDIHPIGPTHILIVTNRHIDSVNELEPEDESLVGHMVLVAKQLAEQEGIAERGYRLIVNTGAHGGQSVFHLHLHLIGGRLARFAIE